MNAQAIKLQYALELLETQTLSSFIKYMRELYQQASEKKSKGVQRLVADKRFAKAYSLATTSLIEHPKLGKLKEIVLHTITENLHAKIIIFAQYRETVRKIAEMLNTLKGVKAKGFIGQASKSGKSDGMNQKEQKKILQEFSLGEINVLAATSIGEEGLDIPEVNEVIFYEPVPSAIRKIQRAGRTARLFPGELKILITKNTRDQTFHYVAGAKERKMHSAINQIKENFAAQEKQEKQEKLEL